MQKFKNSHDSYHAELTTEEDLEESQIYFDQVERLFSEKCFEFRNFLENCELSLMEISMTELVQMIQ